MRKLLLALFLFTGCASVQQVSFDQAAQDPGSLVVQFSDNIKNVRSTLDDRVIRVDKKLTKEMVINNIPPGEHEIQVTASSWELKDDVNFNETIEIESGKQTAVIVSVPPKSGGYWATQVVVFLVSVSLMSTALSAY